MINLFLGSLIANCNLTYSVSFEFLCILLTILKGILRRDSRDLPKVSFAQNCFRNAALGPWALNNFAP